MELIAGKIKLFNLDQGIWHHTEARFDFMNDINGIKLVDSKVYIRYIGGEFTEPYTMWFNLNKETLDVLWKLEFGDAFNQPLDFENKNLDWFCDISLIVYNLVTTNKHQENHFGQA
ncbi:hypothetical protein [Bacillus toyonensis]|uniref:hypothetical protein n=1 Tax=Bacillus toyonensis TaxID=155322 RepID=UPI002E231B76|nr:hypothetical protein [Bacillus toyonensis]